MVFGAVVSDDRFDMIVDQPAEEYSVCTPEYGVQGRRW